MKQLSKEQVERIAKEHQAKNKEKFEYKPKGNIDFVIDFDVFESDEYKRHFAMVGRNPLGHTINQRVVYTPQLAFILTQRLTGFDRVLNEHIKNKVNFDFLKLYSEAYDKGFEYFKTEYLQTDVYLMPQLEFWVKKIDRLYNHDGVYRFGGVANGWNFVKKKYPLIITNEVLHEYGFYSGLCASAEKFNHENKEIFDKYEISVEPKKVENVEPEMKFSQSDIAMICFYNDVMLSSETKDDIASKHGFTAQNSGKKILQHYNDFVVNRVKDKGNLQSNKKLLIKLEKIRSEILPDFIEKFESDLQKVRTNIDNY